MRTRRLCSSDITKTRLFKYTEKFTTEKNENFQIRNSVIFQISAQNIDCGYSLEPPRRGGSNEFPQTIFFSRNKKHSVYPCKPQFYYIKVGFKGVKLYRHVFVMEGCSFPTGLPYYTVHFLRWRFKYITTYTASINATNLSLPAIPLAIIPLWLSLFSVSECALCYTN